MATKSIEAGRAFLKLLIDNTEFRKGLDGSLKVLDDFSKSTRRVGAVLGLAGASLTAPFVAAVTAFSRAGSQIDTLAKRTKFSTQAISELKFAAEQSGTGIDAVAAAAGRMTRLIDAARQGSGNATSTLDRLGISLAHLQGLSPEQQFLRLGQAIARVPDHTERAALAMRVFGNAGRELLPMLENVDALRARARELGVTMDPKTAAAAQAFGDAINQVKTAVTSLAVQVGAQLAPALTSLAESLANVTAMTAKWAGENSTLVISLAALGPILVGLGGTVSGLGDLARGLIATFVGLKVAAAGAFAHPVIAAVLALAGALAYLAYQSGLLQQVWEKLNPKDTIEGLDQQIADARQRIDSRRAWIERQAGQGVSRSALSGHEAAVARAEAALAELEQRRQAVLEEIRQDQLPVRQPLNPSSGVRSPLPALLPALPSASGEFFRRAGAEFAKGATTSWNSGELPARPAGLPNDRFLGRFRPLDSRFIEEAMRARESILDQAQSAFRGSRTTVGGKLAEQIYGSTRGEDREERALRIEESQLDALKRIERAVTSGRPIMVGGS